MHVRACVCVAGGHSDMMLPRRGEVLASSQVSGGLPGDRCEEFVEASG